MLSAYSLLICGPLEENVPRLTGQTEADGWMNNGWMRNERLGCDTVDE